MILHHGRLFARSLPRPALARPILSCAHPWEPARSPPRGLFQGVNRTTWRSYADTNLNLPALDKKWRRKWASLRSNSAKDPGDTPSKYVLPMFPYPSGNLHLGHLRVYTIADVVARFRTLLGDKVMLPMGWDAFGLPAENAAMERGINPATWTRSNIAKMKKQLNIMNGSWDWSRELATCDPAFYKHTQKIFLLLHAQGLAYQNEAEVNYDPVDKTVLANEQVDSHGRSWRSGALVEKRNLKQWFLRISEFRDSLLNDLDSLSKDDAWPERVLAMQRNWLGKSTGATIKFPVMAFQQKVNAAIEVFTSRPDTLFGVQYLALASTHPVVADLAKSDPELQAFLDTLPGLPPDSKIGYLLPHIRAVNPLAYHEDTPEATKQSLPVYVAPYVLGDYGEGAVMGVPGHDVRDHTFWKTHRSDEPVRIVLAASDDESTTAMLNEPYVEHGIMTEHSGIYAGKSSKEAGALLVSMLEAADLAKPVEKWRLRDWLVSRQRYWGTPIPIIHCGSCGAVPVPDADLPVVLPEVDEHWAGKKVGNPLETNQEWVNTTCPKCSGPAKRDTDTMDTFVDSSWYFMRFIDPHNEKVPFDAAKAKALLPVDLYIGGVEHAILHLLYARFIYKFLITSDLVTGEGKDAADAYEPFHRLITQGMVHGKTYSDPTTGGFLKPDEVDLTVPSSPKVVATGETAVVSYEKMSKSKYNGVDPTGVIAQHGADATRAHMLFQAPVSEILDWDGHKIVGVTRWMSRVHDLVLKVGRSSDDTTPATTPNWREYFKAMSATPQAYFEDQSTRVGSMSPSELSRWDTNATIWRDVQKTISSVTESYEKVYSLNTVVSDLMSLTNTIKANASATPIIVSAAVSSLVRMLAPIAPAFAEECWSVLHPDAGSIFEAGAVFPVADGTEVLFQPRRRACAVMFSGKMRFVARIPTPSADLTGEGLKDWIVEELLKTDEGKKAKLDVKAGTAKKVIVVRGGGLVNFVF